MKLNIIDQIFQYRLQQDPKVFALLKRYIVNPAEENLRSLQKKINPEIIYNKLLGKPFRKVTELVTGLIKFAFTEDGIPVGINPDEPHCLIAGQTGCGKTVLLILMLGQAILQGANVWLFSKAKDVTNLLTFSREILVNDFSGQMKINPLLSPGVNVRFWINCFADIFIQAYGLFDGTKNYLIENLNYLFSKNDMPTFYDLHRLIKSQKYNAFSRFARYRESLLNRLGGMITSYLGMTLGYPCIALEELAKRNVIFELQGLTAQQQVFIVNILLTWLFYYKLYHDSTHYHYIGVDDAGLLFDISFEHRPDQALPIISHLVSTVRKSKVNVVVASQIPRQLGSSIHANSFAKIMFGLADGRDRDCMAQSMGVTNPEQRQYLDVLGKREIIVRFSGRYLEPFIAYIPEVPHV
jgi:hypothetical protein